MALHDWWQQAKRLAVSQDEDTVEKALKMTDNLGVFNWRTDDMAARRKVAQWYHGLNEPELTRREGKTIAEIDLQNKKEQAAAQAIFKLHKVEDVHKYYAILMMDGDKIGKLVNGETLGSTWSSVLHPLLAEKLRGSFDKKFKRR